MQHVNWKDPVGAHRQAGIPMVGVTWKDVDLDDADLGGMIFQNCTFERVRLTGASLWRTMFVNCRIDECVFVDCKVFHTQWHECTGSGITLRGDGGELNEAILSQSELENVVIEQAGMRFVLGDNRIGNIAFNGAGTEQRSLTISGGSADAVLAENARWWHASVLDAHLAEWRLDNANLEQCAFIRADAEDLDLSSTTFTRCNLFRSKFAKAKIRSAEGSIFAECDLEEADLVEARLDGALFARADAPRIRLSRAHIDRAMFPEAKLMEADITGASARESAWTGADLSRAHLEGIDAFRASFRHACLAGAHLDGARLVEADLHGVEDTLTGADTRGARETVDWRFEREKEIAKRKADAQQA